VLLFAIFMLLVNNDLLERSLQTQMSMRNKFKNTFWPEAEISDAKPIADDSRAKTMRRCFAACSTPTAFVR
jgi:hypothetical protein